MIDKDKLNRKLLNAAKRGHLNVVELLIEKGADINAKDKDGKTPLHYRVEKDYLDFMKFLIKDEMNFLIEKGADINAKDKDGKTPLHYVVEKGNLNVVKFLIEKGADVNTKDKDGKTLLQLAIEKGKKDISQFLIKHILIQNPSMTKPDFLIGNLGSFWDDRQTQIEKMQNEKIGNTGTSLRTFLNETLYETDIAN